MLSVGLLVNCPMTFEHYSRAHPAVFIFHSSHLNHGVDREKVNVLVLTWKSMRLLRDLLSRDSITKEKSFSSLENTFDTFAYCVKGVLVAQLK